MKWGIEITADWEDLDGKICKVRVDENIDKIATCHNKSSLKIVCDGVSTTAIKRDLENYRAEVVEIE